MKPQVETIPSPFGRTLGLYIWQGGNEKKTIVQLVHGMAEHMRRYEGAAEALVKAGYTVVGHNHAGHGPEAPEAQHGWFGEKDGWSSLIEDIELMRQEAQKRFPGFRHVLLGHSMGSFAAREYLIRYGKNLDAAVISGTGWHPKAVCEAGRTAATLAGKTHGWDKPSPMTAKLVGANSNKAFEPVRTPFDWLSRDNDRVDDYVADPLCGFLFTARGYYDMFSGLKALSDTSRLTAMPKDLPVYFVSGDMDPVGAQGKGVRTVYEQFSAAGLNNLTLRLYEGGRHEMLNETNREEVYADLIRWLEGALQ